MYIRTRFLLLPLVLAIVLATAPVNCLATTYEIQTTCYSWIDPSSHTALSMSDGSASSAQTLPFSFCFYGKSYDHLYVGLNGLLGFASEGLYLSSNTDIPSSYTPNAVIYPFWESLNVSAGGSVRVGTVGTAPDRIFVISWVGVTSYCTPSYSTFQTFQVLLCEGTNNIIFQYQEVQPGDASYGGGRSATIGIEDATGEQAVRYSYYGSSLLANRQAILFVAGPRVTEPSFTPDAGTYSNNQTVTISCATPSATIHYTTNGLDPTTSDSEIGNGQTVTVSANPRTTLKAKAWLTGNQASAVKTVVYWQPTTFYVTSQGNDANDGLSWANAKRTINAMLSGAWGGDRIWVAKGSYGGSITLRNGVALYGGFEGTEEQLNDRSAFPRPSPDPNETVLYPSVSGSVVTAMDCLDPATRIDGFTISGGSGTRIGYDAYGGGIYSENSRLTITYNLIKWCNVRGYDGRDASYGHYGPDVNGQSGGSGLGGGIYCDGSATISHNIVTGNVAQGGFGGDGANGKSGYHWSPGFSGGIGGNCGDGRGGGIYCVGGSAELVDNIISDNHAIAGYDGGHGGRGGWGADASVGYPGGPGGTGGKGGCGYGGGVYFACAAPSLDHCILYGNSAQGSSGGFGGDGGVGGNGYDWNGGDGGSGGRGGDGGNGWGGAVYCTTGEPGINNNVLAACSGHGSGLLRGGSGGTGGAGGWSDHGGSAGSPGSSGLSGTAGTADGGGICCASCSATVTGNTIAGCQADNGAAVSSQGGSLTMSNSVLAFNSSGVLLRSGTAILRNSNIYNPDGYNYSGLSAGSGDISADPVFLDRANGDYHLTLLSPCINSGINSAVGAGSVDLDGRPRVFPADGTIDLGAYEYSAQPVWAPGEAKRLLADGAEAYLTAGGPMTATAVFGGLPAYYVEQSNRVSGIQCRGPVLMTPGQCGVMHGTMGTLDGERVLLSAEVVPGSLATASIPPPWFLINRALGGGGAGLQAGVTGSIGLNIGLLVKTCGKVTASGTDPRMGIVWFYIDDGSGVQDGTGISGLYCEAATGVTPPSMGSYVSVIGISSCEVYKSNLVNVLRVRNQADVVTVSTPPGNLMQTRVSTCDTRPRDVTKPD